MDVETVTLTVSRVPGKSEHGGAAFAVGNEERAYPFEWLHGDGAAVGSTTPRVVFRDRDTGAELERPQVYALTWAKAVGAAVAVVMDRLEAS